MTRAQVSFVAAVVGLFCSLVLYGCGGGDDDNSDFPDVRGVYRGTSTQTNSGCSNPANNGTSTDANATVNISSQSGANFSGTAQGTAGNTVSITGQVTTDGSSSGTITFASGGAAFQGDLYRDTGRQHADREFLWTIHGRRDVCIPAAVYWHTSMTS